MRDVLIATRIGHFFCFLHSPHVNHWYFKCQFRENTSGFSVLSPHGTMLPLGNGECLMFLDFFLSDQLKSHIITLANIYIQVSKIYEVNLSVIFINLQNFSKFQTYKQFFKNSWTKIENILSLLISKRFLDLPVKNKDAFMLKYYVTKKGINNEKKTIFIFVKICIIREFIHADVLGLYANVYKNRRCGMIVNESTLYKRPEWHWN